MNLPPPAWRPMARAFEAREGVGMASPGSSMEGAVNGRVATCSCSSLFSSTTRVTGCFPIFPCLAVAVSKMSVPSAEKRSLVTIVPHEGDMEDGWASALLKILFENEVPNGFIIIFFLKRESKIQKTTFCWVCQP